MGYLKLYVGNHLVSEHAQESLVILDSSRANSRASTELSERVSECLCPKDSYAAKEKFLQSYAPTGIRTRATASLLFNGKAVSCR